jgi:CheY-like chemotaxis protein
MKILVVDDEVDVETLFMQKFRKEIRKGEIEFEFALSGEDALEKWRREGSSKVVLILSDINMPGMNGLELLKRLKQEFPQQKVFIITAYEDTENYQTALEFGADDFINKPIDFDELKRKILGPT